jgi:hypothetical protein
VIPFSIDWYLCAGIFFWQGTVISCRPHDRQGTGSMKYHQRVTQGKKGKLIKNTARISDEIMEMK